MAELIGRESIKLDEEKNQIIRVKWVKVINLGSYIQIKKFL